MKLLVIPLLILSIGLTCAAAIPEANIETRWNFAALQGVRDSKLGAPVVARALAVVHTCIYDAWAAYDERAVGTQLGDVLRRPPGGWPIFDFSCSLNGGGCPKLRGFRSLGTTEFEAGLGKIS